MKEWFQNFLTNTLGFIDKLKTWTMTQRLFYYSILVTIFLVFYFIVLPRYDCTQLKITEACEFLKHEYIKKYK